jgi:hypothetical protein
MNVGGETYDADGVYAVKVGVFAFLDLGEDERVEALRARLFHTLETKAKVDGERLVEGVVGIENVDPTKDGTFVIG